MKVLRRLQKAGYSAHLVGGSVRDLLLRHAPKDFDIATDARPEQIRKLFRNCRLIGRRFRLAHILFGREIIEVATFRAAEDNSKNQRSRTQTGMIIHDNIYGDISSDVWRRDFTVNALYYNISDFSIVDYIGGTADIHQKIIRLIGNPVERYQEDPVRMLRAIRFAAKLEFQIHPDTEEPLYNLSHYLEHVAPARLFEEILKLFHNGHGLRSYELLIKYQLFHKLFPSIRELTQENLELQRLLVTATLKNTDARIQQEKPVTPAFLFTAILWHPLQQRIANLVKTDLPLLSALEQAMNEILQQEVKVLAIPKRLTKVVREIWLLQYRLPRRYGKRPFQSLYHPRFRAAYDFLMLRTQIGEVESELGEWWTQFQEVDEITQYKMIAKLNKK